jgi:hypothetical protein
VLARCTKIRHPLGAIIDLPRLVPAFSSKGFPFVSVTDPAPRLKVKSARRTNAGRKIKKEARREISEASLALELVGPFIRDSILLSAYDLHHRHFRRPENFYREKELVFLDSGGYELSPGFDQTEPVYWGTPKKNFSEADYRAVLRSLPRDLPFVISNFDWGTRSKPLTQQIAAAQGLFQEFPCFLKNFIVKPGTQRFIEVDEVVRHVKKLSAFDILGVTEKELGKDLMEKLRTIAKLRLSMDREDIKIPIHVWGGLDPIRTPLYFFAGAEIFDGISWLRYAYVDGVAVYRDCYSVLAGEIETPLDHARALCLSHNLGFLRTLATSFRDFVLRGGDGFNMFGPHAGVMEKAYRALVTQVPSIEGGK